MRSLKGRGSWGLVFVLAGRVLQALTKKASAAAAIMEKVPAWRMHCQRGFRKSRWLSFMTGVTPGLIKVSKADGLDCGFEAAFQGASAICPRKSVLFKIFTTNPCFF